MTANDDKRAELLSDFVARQQAGGGSEAILDRAAVEIFEALAASGADALLLKGAGLARMLYAQGERRKYVDIDILAAPADFERAGSALATLGYHNASAGRGIDDIGGVVHEELWLGSATTDTYPIQVELHRWLPGARATPDVAWRALCVHRTSIELDRGQVPVLERPGQALQLATHAAQHGPAYAKGLGELALALERWPREVWKRAAALAEAVDGTAAFAAGLRLVEPGVELAATLELPASDALDWEIRHLDDRPRGVFHLEAWREARGLSGRLRVLRRALVPDRRWLAIEYRWAERGGPLLALAYALHALRAPLWAARALVFRRRSRGPG